MSILHQGDKAAMKMFTFDSSHQREAEWPPWWNSLWHSVTPDIVWPVNKTQLSSLSLWIFHVSQQNKLFKQHICYMSSVQTSFCLLHTFQKLSENQVFSGGFYNLHACTKALMISTLYMWLVIILKQLKVLVFDLVLQSVTETLTFGFSESILGLWPTIMNNQYVTPVEIQCPPSGHSQQRPLSLIWP